MPRKREVLHVPGLSGHKNLIPTAVRIGGYVYSSAIGGSDPETDKVPDDPAEQVLNAFGHIRRVMEVAGGSPDDLAKMTVFLKDKAYRELVNKEWVAMFPDPEDRPVRHALTVTDLPGNYVVQLEIVAVL